MLQENILVRMYQVDDTQTFTYVASQIKNISPASNLVQTRLSVNKDCFGLDSTHSQNQLTFGSHHMHIGVDTNMRRIVFHLD